MLPQTRKQLVYVHPPIWNILQKLVNINTYNMHLLVDTNVQFHILFMGIFGLQNQLQFDLNTYIQKTNLNEILDQTSAAVWS